MTQPLNTLKTQRAIAWHNIITTAIDHALSEGVLSLDLKDDEKAWPNYDQRSEHRMPRHSFSFRYVGRSWTAHIEDIGCGEVSIRIDSPDTDTRVFGWLERESDTYLQVPSRFGFTFLTLPKDVASEAGVQLRERSGYGIGRVHH